VRRADSSPLFFRTADFRFGLPLRHFFGCLAFAAALVRVISTATNRYRENGYINHATPTPIATNSTNDHATFLIRSAAVRIVKHPSATETSKANEIIAQK
jgi:hypothetical protein